MKQLLLFAGFIIASFTLHSQTVRKDANGNYVAVKSLADSSSAKSTGQTYTDSKGNVYPVMISKNGKLFVVRTSKSGTRYNSYLKLEN